jgi:hypothetical protein
LDSDARHGGLMGFGTLDAAAPIDYEPWVSVEPAASDNAPASQASPADGEIEANTDPA